MRMVARKRKCPPEIDLTNAGMAALSNRGSSLHTAYSALAIDGYLRASNVDAKYTIAHTPTAVSHSWNLA